MEPFLSDLPPRVPAERILVIQFRQIGDVLLSTPVLRALRCSYPRSYIAFLTEPSSGRVLQGNPWLDEVIIRSRHATWREQWQLLRHIRRHHFDLVIDLIGNPRSAVLTRLSGARHRLAFARFPRSLLYTMLVTHHQLAPEYTVAKRLRLLEPLGIRATDLTPSLSYTQREQDEVTTFLHAHAITPKDLLICIDPTHHVPTRQWPGASFSVFVDMLSERLGARVLLLWGPGEEAQVQGDCCRCVLSPRAHPCLGSQYSGSAARTGRSLYRVQLCSPAHCGQSGHTNRDHHGGNAQRQLAPARAAAPRCARWAPLPAM